MFIECVYIIAFVIIFNYIIYLHTLVRGHSQIDTHMHTHTVDIMYIECLTTQYSEVLS